MTPSGPDSTIPSRVRRVADFALQRRASDVVIVDLRERSTATDFFVIASGRSDVHVRAIADHVLDSAKREDSRPEHVEGIAEGRWVLLDYIDHVVHVFQPAVRDYYRLESLWGDAPATEVDDHPGL